MHLTGLETRLYLSVQHDEIYCKLRAGYDRLLRCVCKALCFAGAKARVLAKGDADNRTRAVIAQSPRSLRARRTTECFLWS